MATVAAKPGGGKPRRPHGLAMFLALALGVVGVGVSTISLARQEHELTARELFEGPGQLGGGNETSWDVDLSGAAGNASAGNFSLARRASLAQLGGADGTLGALSPEEADAAEKAEAIRQGMLHAWRGYERFAMGAAELHPVSKTAKQDIMGGQGITGLGVTVVDAMSTLHLMGFKDEFDRARDFLYGSLSFDKAVTVSFFEITIRLLGGLVSCYDLSADRMFLDKALDLGNRLLPYFGNGGTGLAAGTVQLSGGGGGGGAGGSLATVGSNLLEFGSLSLRSGRPEFLAKAEAGIRRLHRCHPGQGLLPKNIDSGGRANGQEFSVGAEADSYFEYLLKYWILTGKEDNHWRKRWEQAVDDVMAKLVPQFSTNPDVAFTGERHGGHLDMQLEHLACFWPGNVALGVMNGAVKGPKAELYLKFAERMTWACFQLYNITATGLGAERITFDQKGNPTVTAPIYWQRPEVIESIFYLWRATHNPKYRDWGWAMFSAFEKHCRQEAGYAGVHDVNQVPPQLDDAQQSWLLAETFKYWYLLFAPDSAFSLEDWVLNTEAHPLRVWAPSNATSRFNQRRQGRPDDDKWDEDSLDPCFGEQPVKKCPSLAELQKRQQQQQQRKQPDRPKGEPQEGGEEGKASEDYSDTAGDGSEESEQAKQEAGADAARKEAMRQAVQAQQVAKAADEGAGAREATERLRKQRLERLEQDRAKRQQAALKRMEEQRQRNTALQQQRLAAQQGQQQGQAGAADGQQGAATGAEQQQQQQQQQQQVGAVDGQQGAARTEQQQQQEQEQGGGGVADQKQAAQRKGGGRKHGPRRKGGKGGAAGQAGQGGAAAGQAGAQKQPDNAAGAQQAAAGAGAADGQGQAQAANDQPAQGAEAAVEVAVQGGAAAADTAAQQQQQQQPQQGNTAANGVGAAGNQQAGAAAEGAAGAGAGGAAAAGGQAQAGNEQQAQGGATAAEGGAQAQQAGDAGAAGRAGLAGNQQQAAAAAERGAAAAAAATAQGGGDPQAAAAQQQQQQQQQPANAAQALQQQQEQQAGGRAGQNTELQQGVVQPVLPEQQHQVGVVAA